MDVVSEVIFFFTGGRLINVNKISVQSLKYTSFVINMFYIISLLCEVLLYLTEQPQKRCD